MSDEVIACVECGRTFTWSYGEQRYFKEHGLDRPKRCPACRSERKAPPPIGTRDRTSPASHTSGSPAQRRPEQGRIRRVGPPRWLEGPAVRFGVVTLGAAIALAAVLAAGSRLDGLQSWLISISIITLLAYGYDKAVAGSEHTRVPEKVLLVLALVGGTVGAVAGMRLFHHKTAKGSFQLELLGVALVQAVLVGVYYLFINR